MIRVEDGTQIWVEDMLAAQTGSARLEVGADAAAGLRLAASGASGDRSPSPRGVKRGSKSPPPRRDLTDDDTQPRGKRKPTTFSCAGIMSGRRCIAIGCRMGCSICCEPSSWIPR